MPLLGSAIFYAFFVGLICVLSAHARHIDFSQQKVKIENGDKISGIHKIYSYFGFFPQKLLLHVFQPQSLNKRGSCCINY